MFPDLFRDDVFTLETPRLFLRWPKASDAAAIVTLAGDRRVAEMTARIPHPYPADEATKFIIAVRNANADGHQLMLAISTRTNPEKLIGMIGVERGCAGTEFGYWLGVPHWGKGYMTEAAQALIDALFLYTEEDAVSASIRVMNTASRKVLEHCGFQYEGGGMCIRPAWGDSTPSDTYRLTRSLWSSLKGWRAPVPYGRELAAGGM
ncbi:MAG: GNAT family N-acetyltransferase [Rhizobiales bacterium PAR1]|nr:MAG: GNAT family N-acetyltransferase [Rhizobiales bacterium PAR1]